MPQPDKSQPDKDDELPFAVELWREDGGQVEKILARAFSLSLARAISRAAVDEHPDRRITVRHGERVVEQNGD